VTYKKTSFFQKQIFFGGDSWSSIWHFKVHDMIMRDNKAEIRSVTR